MKKYFLPLLLLTSTSYQTIEATFLPKKTFFTAFVVAMITAYNMHVLKQQPQHKQRNPQDILGLAVLETTQDAITLADQGLKKLIKLVASKKEEIESRPLIPLGRNEQPHHPASEKADEMLKATLQQLEETKQNFNSSLEKLEDINSTQKPSSSASELNGTGQPDNHSPEATSDLEKDSNTKLA